MKPGIRRRAALVLVAVLASACTGGAGDAELAKATGPPKVDLEAVVRHAEQFDTQIPIRLAGSQEEEIASSYLLAHMQQAGYLVRLDGVPVKDLVNSTNVIAPPPSGADPTTVVAVAYDTTREDPSDGALLGLWLELARALNVKDPDHTVEFVALGANHADVEGAPLGAGRLARFLVDEELDPSVIEIYSTKLGPRTERAHLSAISGFGPEIEQILTFAGPAARPTGVGPPGPDPLRDAGLDHTFVGGDAEAIGVALLRYLSEAPS
jgi:hypothetical protein